MTLHTSNRPAGPLPQHVAALVARRAGDFPALALELPDPLELGEDVAAFGAWHIGVAQVRAIIVTYDPADKFYNLIGTESDRVQVSQWFRRNGVPVVRIGAPLQ